MALVLTPKTFPFSLGGLLPPFPGGPGTIEGDGVGLGDGSRVGVGDSEGSALGEGEGKSDGSVEGEGLTTTGLGEELGAGQ